jgi:hypothetical protein
VKHDDDLDGARGIAFGLAVSAFAWLLIYLLWRIVR